MLRTVSVSSICCYNRSLELATLPPRIIMMDLSESADFSMRSQLNHALSVQYCTPSYPIRQYWDLAPIRLMQTCLRRKRWLALVAHRRTAHRGRPVPADQNELSSVVPYAVYSMLYRGKYALSSVITSATPYRTLQTERLFRSGRNCSVIHSCREM